MYGINSIIKCGTWEPVKFQLVSQTWNEVMIFYRNSELMLSTFMQSYDEKSFTLQLSKIIYFQFKTERLTESHVLWWY